MKKIISIVVIVGMLVGLLVGCGNSTDKTDAATSKETKGLELVDNDGILVATDISDNVPFDDAGFKIEIKKASDGYAKFTITDKNGNETADYYNFDFSTGEVEKYHYVSMMGTGFYYYYDMELEELVRLEDDDHVDSTQSSKDGGRWDSAAEDTAAEMKLIEDYFASEFESSIENYVTK